MVENDFKFIDKCPITGDDKKITYLELGQIDTIVSNENRLWQPVVIVIKLVVTTPFD